jgi:serine-type D-Ala-D-Ala carboxypeptidase (penicillin-binding protein 5/6)
MSNIHFRSLFLCVIFAVILPGRVATAAPSQKTIPAKAAIVMDESGSVLYAKYPDAKLAPASTVKLMTAMVALDRLDPEQKVRISRNAAAVRSIRPRIRRDEEMSVFDLLHLALMKSINSAAVAIAETAAGSEQNFVALMNQKAKEIGANDTLFANASGLPKGTQYTTARDLALIMKHALSYPLIKEIIGKKGSLITTTGGREIFVANTDDLLWHKDNMIGGKTGYTGDARHCFVGAVNTERGTIFTAVLGARSRACLWRSARILVELGTDTGLATSPERSSGIQKVSHKTGRRSNGVKAHVVSPKPI